MLEKLKNNMSLCVFASLFAGVGLGFLLLSILPSLWEWQAMKSWQQTHAQLLSARLETHRGDDSDTYEAVARYRYRIGGQSYTNDRIGIMGGADNIGDYQTRQARRLVRAHAQQQSVEVWVNPQNPAEAVLDRELRWSMIGFKMIFVVVFGGIGIAMLCWALMAKQDRTKTGENTSVPANARIGSGGKAGLYSIWGFAIFWNLVTSFLWFVIPDELANGNYAVLVALLFPLAGVGMLLWAIKQTLAWRRFGELYLMLDPVPGSVGGQVGATLELPLAFNADYHFPVSLSCVNSYVSGTGKDRSRRERIRWQGQGFAYSEASGTGTRLSFCFDVPEGLPASERLSNNYHFWRLEVRADLPGMDLLRHFTIPVQATARQSRYLRQRATDHPLATQLRDMRLESVLHMRQVSGGVELYFSLFRNLGIKLGFLLFGIILGGSGLLIAHLDGPVFMSILFAGIGGLVTALCLYGLFNCLRVRLTREGLWTRRELLGVIIRRQFYPASTIKLLRLHKGYSSQSGSGYVEMFSIVAELHSGKQVTVAESLRGREDARQALEAISLLTGYHAEKS